MKPSKKKTLFVRRALTTMLILCPLAVLIGRPYFVRARGVARTNSCICNLRQIDGAIQQWALENQKKPENKVTMADITAYLKHGVHCPQGGKYVIGPTITNTPACSIPSHALP